MDSRIQLRIESARGCGYRKESGLYMVNHDPISPCGKLPVLLEVCPVCGGGIRPARQWVWVEGDQLLQEARQRPCAICAKYKDHKCIMTGHEKIGKAGLLWVGEKYYPSPEDFMKEAWQVGVSRRVNFVPYNFDLGKTWILLGHRMAVDGKPGIFFLFKPSVIEYVCKGDEAEEEVSKLLQRGLTPVKIIQKDLEFV